MVVKVVVVVGGRRVSLAAHHLTVAGRQLWVGHLCLCHPEPWRVEAGAKLHLGISQQSRCHHCQGEIDAAVVCDVFAMNILWNWQLKSSR